VAGYGHADKQQMQLMVRALLGMSETPEPTDAADALAVALCHIQAAQFRARLNAGTSRRSAIDASSDPRSNSDGNVRIKSNDNAGENLAAPDFAASPLGTQSRRAVSRIQRSRSPVLR
jgi:hypothetical protein